MSRVAVLSSQSLFAEGVATRLKQFLEVDALVMVDARRDDALDQVVAMQPSAVIVDAGDTAAEQFCSLGKLLEALPLLTVIRLDSHSSYVQVVTSAERRLSQVHDLIDVIKAAKA